MCIFTYTGICRKYIRRTPFQYRQYKILPVVLNAAILEVGLVSFAFLRSCYKYFFFQLSYPSSGHRKRIGCIEASFPIINRSTVPKYCHFKMLHHWVHHLPRKIDNYIEDVFREVSDWNWLPHTLCFAEAVSTNILLKWVIEHPLILWKGASTKVTDKH